MGPSDLSGINYANYLQNLGLIPETQPTFPHGKIIVYWDFRSASSTPFSVANKSYFWVKIGGKLFKFVYKHHLSTDWQS